MEWVVAKIDFTSSILQPGYAKRGFYVMPPRECRNRHYYRLLLTSVYSFINANAKWQEDCYSLFHELSLNQSIEMPQLFSRNPISLEFDAVKSLVIY